MQEHAEEIIMLILSLFVLQVLPAAFCYDIELQGKVKVANKYLTVLSQPSDLVNLILSYLPAKIVGKGKLPAALETIAIPYLRTTNNTEKQKTQVETQTTETPKQLHQPSFELEKFMKHLQDKGVETTHNISEEILTHLNLKKNITSIVAIVTGDYKNMLKNYYEYVKKYQDDSDKDLLYLDMIETSCRLLFDSQKKLLNDIIMQENQKYHKYFEKITRVLLKRSYIYKRETMRYVCDIYKICKEYPAISDYGSEIISELLMLDDLQFGTVLKILANIFKQNDKFFARFTEKEDRQLITAKLIHFTDDLFATKEYFALVRAVITQRFKPITSGSEEFKTKTKAIRILMDIIDKALNIENDVITIDAENFLHAIRQWAAYKREDIVEIFGEFVKNLIIRLEHNLTKRGKKEIKSLITGLMRNITGVTFNRLMKSGSYYVKEEDFHPDVDMMDSDYYSD